MGNIIEAANLPNDEKVYLKKDFLGWRVVEPYKDENGKINWFKFIFGSKRNLVFLIIVLVIGFGLYMGVQELISGYKTIAENPCNFCKTCIDIVRNTNNELPNLSPLING